MAKVHKLKYSINRVLEHNKDGAFETQRNRKTMLHMFAYELHELGYEVTDIRTLKEKHVRALVNKWLEDGKDNGTIKNRMANIRWLSKKINKEAVIPSNKDLGISNRSYIPTYNRAIFNPDFSNITDPYIRISVELQRVFGLRREESIKIHPVIADGGHVLHILGPWSKSGRPRDIPIRTQEQRIILEEAKSFVQHDKERSLIPVNKKYKAQRSLYDKQVELAELNNLHGLRHAYAQMRYKELTGLDAPINGGPSKWQLTKEQQKQVEKAKKTLTLELGHNRVQILTSYISR